jgi:hypothetical protein
MLTTACAVAVGAAAASLTVASMNDIKRYIRIRQM